MAESMIRLSGLKPHEDITITYTGLRPGEKLFEELNTKDDHVDQTRHPKIFIGKIKEYESEKIDTSCRKINITLSEWIRSGAAQVIAELLPESMLATVSDSPQSKSS